LPLRILLCEDNTINQKVAARILQQLGYKCDLAANGLEGLDALDRQHYDLVFMDMMMPEMDGLTATRAIRERQKDGAAHPNYNSRILIIAMTAHAQQADRESCIAAGMDDYLAKPIRPADLRGMIERWAPQIHPAAANQPASAPDAAVAAAVAQAVSAPAGEPPVEMTRLMDLTDGNADSVRELVDLFYKQTEKQLQQIEDAIRAGNAAEVGHVAHSCKGASATLGMTRLAAGLLQLEKLGKSGALNGAEQLCAAARGEFKNIRDFLSAHPVISGTTQPAQSAVAPPAAEPPVEMSRLADLTEGNPDSMRELVDLFYKQTEKQFKQIEDAVRANKPADVGHIAHSCKGASATLGMTRLAAVLLKLEKLGKSGALAGAEEFCAQARREFKDIQTFLAGHPALAVTPPK
jgi:CheY-like chemotaxis protein